MNGKALFVISRKAAFSPQRPEPERYRQECLCYAISLFMSSRYNTRCFKYFQVKTKAFYGKIIPILICRYYTDK